MAGVKSMNKVIFIGNVQPKEPEVKEVGGVQLANFTLVTKDGYFDKSKNWKETSEWHNIVAWSYLAKKVKEKIGKGSLVCVEGMIKTSKWESDGGDKKSRTTITASTITILDAKKPEEITPQETISPEITPTPDSIGFDDPFR